MRVSSRSKAIALLLLVSCQYSFAALDVALCSSALCYPKVTGQKWGDASRKCPEGYELGKDLFGKAVCTKKTAVACPAGSTLKDGNCVSSEVVKKCHPLLPGQQCPAGTSESKDCEGPLHKLIPTLGRKLAQADNPLFKEINVVGTSYIPNVILPKPAFSVNMKPPKPREGPKFNLPSMTIPQLILPEPAISISMPTPPKLGPTVKWEGSPNIIPTIIPILPEPAFTVDVPKDMIPGGPKVNTHINYRPLTIDLSKVGPANTVDINVPELPDLIGEATRLPDIDMFVPEGPKVLDLSGLGPKTQLNIKLPELTLPDQGTITIVNSGAAEPQYLDLTGLGPKNQTQYNIKLPSTETNGAVLNIIADDMLANVSSITVPGKGDRHNTVINLPEFKDVPQRNAKLVIDVKGNPSLKNITELMDRAPKVTTKKISVEMPEIDLSKSLPAGPNVLIDIKPLIKLNSSTIPKSETQLKRVEIKPVADITIPRMVNDTTIHIKPLTIGSLGDLLAKKGLKIDENAKETRTSSVINLPDSILPTIPVPKGKTDVAVAVPLSLGLQKFFGVKGNSSEPDAVVHVSYKEEWTGGNATLPNPGSHVANALGAAVNKITTLACPTACCSETTVEKSVPQQFTVDSVPAKVECDKGCTYDLKQDKCLCAPGTVEDCPAGTTKCSIGSKGVCAPDLPAHAKFGLDACLAFKAVCSQPGLMFAKTCGKA
ncbi:hypothetical protein OEZ86_007345 [Tetradesmus obliquus]|nr:hypothetical protein OEZ86_007345 [Tetradesmus obliquus]